MEILKPGFEKFLPDIGFLEELAQRTEKDPEFTKFIIPGMLIITFITMLFSIRAYSRLREEERKELREIGRWLTIIGLFPGACFLFYKMAESMGENFALSTVFFSFLSLIFILLLEKLKKIKVKRNGNS